MSSAPASPAEPPPLVLMIEGARNLERECCAARAAVAERLALIRQTEAVVFGKRRTPRALSDIDEAITALEAATARFAIVAAAALPGSAAAQLIDGAIAVTAATEAALRGLQAMLPTAWECLYQVEVALRIPPARRLPRDGNLDDYQRRWRDIAKQVEVAALAAMPAELPQA